MRTKILISLVFIFLLTGCASLTSPARQHQLEEGKIYWFDYDASRRGAVLIPNHERKNIAICAEPSPDVALEILNKFKADVAVKEVEVGAEAEVQEKVIQLAKRSQTLMFLRESLYRLCELSLNFQLKDEEVKKLYEKVIDAAAKMAEAELLNAQQSKIEAETKKLEVTNQLKSWHHKIDLIIAYVQDNGKVNGDRLGQLTKNTGLEKTFKKFNGQDIEKLKEALETRYLGNVDALAGNIKK